MTDTDRNKTQLERLVKGAPSWWYVIVNTSKLTAKTHSEHVRAILDCPAVFIEGKGGDTRPMHIMSFNALSGLLDELQDCILNLDISKAQPLPTPYRQMDLLPVDDVPVVTMDEPLRQPVIAPTPAPTPAPVAVMERYLPNESQALLFETLERELTLLGGVEAVLDKFPAEVVKQWHILNAMSGEERIKAAHVCSTGVFVITKRHMTPVGVLVIAWRKVVREMPMRTKMHLKELPTLLYRLGHRSAKNNLIAVISKHI